MKLHFTRFHIITALWALLLSLCLFIGSESLFGKEGGMTSQDPPRPSTLVKLRGGNHRHYASIVFQFSDSFSYDSPQIRGDRIHLKVKNVKTQLPSFTSYKALDSWVALRKRADNLSLTIGVPHSFRRHHTFMLPNPPRLVVNLYRGNAPVKSNTLTAYRAGRHDGYSSVVFQCSDTITYTGPVIEKGRFAFRLKNVQSSLEPLRKFTNVESWVEIRKSGDDLDVSLGIPPSTAKHKIFLLKNPHRLVCNLYRGKGIQKEPPSEKGKAPLITTTLETAAPVKDPVTTINTTVSPTPVVAPAPPSPAGAAQYPLFRGDDRQRGLIRARILSRRGLFEESLKMYRLLRKSYPADEEIWVDYIETLVNAEKYELALYETKKLYKKNPSNLRAQRIEARIYVENQEPQWTFPIYDALLSHYRNDAGIWSDYAYSRQDAGDWSSALNYFSRVLELDSENENALRNVHAILKEHRPRLETGYRFYLFGDGDASFGTYNLNYNRHVSRDTRLDVTYNRIAIDRTLSPGVTEVDTTIDDVMATLDSRISDDWQLRLGAGLFSGIGGDASFLVDTDYKLWNNATAHAGFIFRRPWYDPIEAAELEGRYNNAYLSFSWTIQQDWDLYLRTEYWKYLALREGMEDRDYGRKRTYTAILSRRLHTDPDISISYSYYRSRFNYEDNNYTPISMLESEGVHSLSGRFEHWPCTYWAYGLSGGVRRDHIRALSSWYFQPELTLRLGNRIEGRMNYEYSNEEDSVAGGTTHTFNLWLRLIF